MTNPEKHIALVCNPTPENRKALAITDGIALLLKGMNIRFSIFTAYWPQNWEGITDAWIIGGDGTINWFINQYPDIKIPLSRFAGGSGNDFHWMLYGDMKPEQQVDLLLTKNPEWIDAGICNEKLFINGVGIGFDGAIVKDLLGKRKLAGKASYLVSILKNIVSYHEKNYNFQFDGENFSRDCLLISVANAKRYGGGFMVAPRASLKDELLDINIIGHISPLNRIRFLPVIEKGEHLDQSFADYRQTPSIRITSAQPVHAHMDGEYFFEKSFEVTILPKRFSFIY
jgi:YegS/Rv2252/BmrU family lipid kinase